MDPTSMNPRILETVLQFPSMQIFSGRVHRLEFDSLRSLGSKSSNVLHLELREIASKFVDLKRLMEACKGLCTLILEFDNAFEMVKALPFRQSNNIISPSSNTSENLSREYTVHSDYLGHRSRSREPRNSLDLFTRLKRIRLDAWFLVAGWACRAENEELFPCDVFLSGIEVMYLTIWHD